MSAGCAIVASRTPPIEEVIEHRKQGLLVDFFDSGALAAQVADVLANRNEMLEMREQARRLVVDRFDFETACLPRQLELLGLSRS